MNSTRLFWRIFGLLVVLYLILAIGLVLFVASRQRSMVNETMADRLHEIAILVGEQIAASETISAVELQETVTTLATSTDSRLTIILEDGTVIADSSTDPKTLDNHADRPEIRSAREDGYGTSTRHSDTLEFGMLYVCISKKLEQPLLPTPGPNPESSLPQSQSPLLLIRAAKSTASLDQQITNINRSLWTFAISLATIAGLATWLVTRRVIQPLSRITEAANSIAKGNYETVVDVNRHVSEWGTVATAFNEMQRELQEREEALKANSRRLGTVLASMSEGVIAVSGSGVIQFSNRAAIRLLSLEQQEAIDGRSIFEVVRVPLVRQTLEEVWLTGESKRCEFETRSTPRKILLMRVSRLPAEETKGLVCVIHDMTEIRQLETMRRDFVANVSHELKTPLSSIKAYAETLRLGAINDQKRNVEFVERIESQADRLHQLILDLLHLARVESGQTLYEVTSINVSKVIIASIESFKRLAASREIELTNEMDSELRVSADSEGLRAMVENLISNALRYTQPQGRVSVSCYAEGNYGVVEVTDTGIGIAPEHQQRVFERFYRVDKARSSDLGGTGLGLAIVKHLANSFGGNVTVESKVGRGSSFFVRLPIEN